MQIRCYHCHKPFAMLKEQVILALNEISEQELHHYNAVCPHCGRSNRLSPKELKHSVPDWTPAKKVKARPDSEAVVKTTTKEKTAAKKKTSSKKETSTKKEAATKKKTTAKKEAGTKKETAAKKKTATKIETATEKNA